MLDASAYAPIKVSKGKECNALPDWLGSFSLDKYVTHGANSFLQSQKNKINELRGNVSRKLSLGVLEAC